MIRNADVDDIAALLPMAKEFIEQAYARLNVPYDKESCTDLLHRLIDEEYGILLTNRDCTAMFGCFVHPWHFNRNILTATEIFMWGEGGLRLKNRAEEMAFELGAKSIHMANQEHMRSKALARFYRMDGYTPSENIFVKELV